MIIIGELINASRKTIRAAIEARDVEAIQKVARAQAEAGADYIDVNAGIFVEKEPACLKWLVQVAQEATDTPCCIDSPSPAAIEAALSVHKGVAMINSISLEKERLNALLPVVADAGLKVVALCMSDKGMPRTTEERLAIADELINVLAKNNIPMGNIYVDPLVQPISTNATFGVSFLDAIEAITTRFDGVHTVCGLSNISYGLPARKMLNRVFAVMAIIRGLDALIVNPLDAPMAAEIVAAQALAGKDEFCMNYLKAFRSGLLQAN